MKISRRSVLRISGLTAAMLALSGCTGTGSGAIGGNLCQMFQKILGKSSGASSSASASSAASAAASSEAASAAASSAADSVAASSLPESAPLVTLPDYDADFLTGAARRGSDRIVGVMINNISASEKQNARPQRGLSSADLLIESKVEGGITRFCAVFHKASEIPEVGPIRSGRDQFLQLLMPWQAVYYHDGESIFCTQFVNVYHYSGLNIGGKNYFNTPVHPFIAHRDSRGRNVAYEHTEFTSGKEIVQAAQNAGIGLTYPYEESTFFRFADYRTEEVNKLAGYPTATSINIVHSNSYKTSFAYSNLSKTYKMRMYSHLAKKFEDTVDELTGKQLAFDNVVVCFASIAAYAGDSHDVQQVDYVAGGEAYLFTRGGVQVGRWEKPHPTQPLKLYADNGEEMKLNRGKTYLALVDDEEWPNFNYQ